MVRKTRKDEPAPPAPPKNEPLPPEAADGAPDIPGQVVLVFQGGGALGAYQAGVYQALHDARSSRTG